MPILSLLKVTFAVALGSAAAVNPRTTLPTWAEHMIPPPDLIVVNVEVNLGPGATDADYERANEDMDHMRRLMAEWQ